MFPKIRQYICFNSGTEDDAFDIFQDAMVCLCRWIQEGRFDEKHEVSAFLYSVSRNLWINKVKKDKRSVQWPEEMEIADNYDYSNDIITEQKAKTLQDVIRRLGEKCYQLLKYAIKNGKSNDEICQLMKFSTVNAVKTQKYKCKQKLIKMIESTPGLKEVFD